MYGQNGNNPLSLYETLNVRSGKAADINCAKY